MHRTKRIALISCSKPKLAIPAKAKDMYQSQLFKSTYKLVKLVGFDYIYILSAKYGLIHPSSVIEPYDVTLSKMPVSSRHRWESQVWTDLVEEAQRVGLSLVLDEFHFYAGKAYTQHLVEQLTNVHEPLKGLGVGVRLKWIKESIEAQQTKQHIS